MPNPNPIPNLIALLLVALLLVACDGGGREDDTASTAPNGGGDGGVETFNATASGAVSGDFEDAIGVDLCANGFTTLSWQMSRTLSPDAPFIGSVMVALPPDVAVGTYTSDNQNFEEIGFVDLSVGLDAGDTSYVGPTWSIALTEVAGTAFAATFSATLYPLGEDFLADTTQPAVEVVGDFRTPIDAPCP
ncbi:MAG: hypothetical protein AAFV53_10190 [Myxococcota bacterium]